jgi:hypothetical protein
MTMPLAILVSCFEIIGAPLTTVRDSALLPADGVFPAWKRAESTHVFTGSDLYGYIDGGAEIFLEFGFEQLTVQAYSPSAPDPKKTTADELKVEIYRMVDPIAATGIYLMSTGRQSPDQAFRERHTLNRFQLTFQHSRYYVVVNNAEGNEKLQPDMIELGRFIAGHLPAEMPIAQDEALPQAGLDKTSVRLIRGPYALQSIYTLGSGDILQLRGELTAVSGSYQDASGRYTLVLVDYPNEQAARQAFLNVHGNLDPHLKIQEKNERRFVFKDYNNEYGVISLAAKRLVVRVHLVNQPAPEP